MDDKKNIPLLREECHQNKTLTYAFITFKVIGRFNFIPYSIIDKVFLLKLIFATSGANITAKIYNAHDNVNIIIFNGNSKLTKMIATIRVMITLMISLTFSMTKNFKY